MPMALKSRELPQSGRRDSQAAAATESVDRGGRALYAVRRDEFCGRGERAMSGFDKREEGFEKKFAHDEELRFKAMARRNKLLGNWAAEKLGLSGGDAEAYAKSVVMADFDEPGDEDVFRKVRADLDAKSVAVSDEELRRVMNDLIGKAIEEIKDGR
jgi:hypothetical protein